MTRLAGGTPRHRSSQRRVVDGRTPPALGRQFGRNANANQDSSARTSRQVTLAQDSGIDAPAAPPAEVAEHFDTAKNATPTPEEFDAARRDRARHRAWRLRCAGRRHPHIQARPGDSDSGSEAPQPPPVYSDRKPNGEWAPGNSGRDGFKDEQDTSGARERRTRIYRLAGRRSTQAAGRRRRPNPPVPCLYNKGGGPSIRCKGMLDGSYRLVNSNTRNSRSAQCR